MERNIYKIGKELFITSDEEITGFENNIWVYNNGIVWLWQNTMALRSDNKPKKIILTTDVDLIKDGVQAIDDEFLEWICNNPSCEEVEVQKWFDGVDFLEYKIIIPKEEHKQETVDMKTEKQKPIQLRNPNLPAFPTEFSYGDEDFTGQPIINKKKYAGVTKREYFTAKALGGFMARHGAVDFSEADADRIMLAVDMMLAKCKML